MVCCRITELTHGPKELVSTSRTVPPHYLTAPVFPIGVTLSRSEGSVALGDEMLRYPTNQQAHVIVCVLIGP